MRKIKFLLISLIRLPKTLQNLHAKQEQLAAEIDELRSLSLRIAELTDAFEQLLLTQNHSGKTTEEE